MRAAGDTCFVRFSFMEGMGEQWQMSPVEGDW